MSVKVCDIVINDYSFKTYVNTKYLDEWRSAGVDIIVVENTIPITVVILGLTKIWCRLQDLWNWKLRKE